MSGDSRKGRHMKRKPLVICALALTFALTAMLFAGCSSDESTTQRHNLDGVNVTVDKAWKSSHPTTTTYFRNDAATQEGTEMTWFNESLGASAPLTTDSAENIAAYEQYEIGVEYPSTDTSTTVIDPDVQTIDDMPVSTATVTVTGDAPSTTRIACLVYLQKAYFLTYTAMEGETVESPFDAVLASMERG